MKLAIRIAAALVAAAFALPAFGQSYSGQVAPGQVYGNAGAAAAKPQGSSVTSILDRALGSTRGAVLERGASGWGVVGPGTSGLPWVANGAGADPAYQALGNSGLAQMPASTVKCNPTGSTAAAQDCANPSITSLTASLSVVAPTVSGGGLSNSQLLLQSTFGAGSGDSIVFQTGNQVQRGAILSNGSFLWATGTASQTVAPYGGGATGVAAWSITNSDNSALTGTERYTAWISNTSNGTGDGTVPGTTYALGVSSLKNNWTTTGVAGQTIGLLVTARGGYNNAVNNGDTAAINANVGASYSNNLSQLFEGVSGYFPAGSTSGSLFVDVQIASIRATGLGDIGNNVSYGYFAQAQNGANGVAFGASNLKTSPKYGNAATWGYFLKYDNDDGTHAGYTSFSVLPSGAMTIAGFGAAGTNQKTFRVGGSVSNDLEIVNAANSAVIYSLSDAGTMKIANGSFAANGGATAPSFGGNTLPTAVTTNSVAKWLQITDQSGTNLYIPAWH